jgi:signal transduction histidine kinase
MRKRRRIDPEVKEKYKKFHEQYGVAVPRSTQIKYMMFGIGFMITTILICWSLSYVVIDYVYDRWFPEAAERHPMLQDFFRTLLSMFIGFNIINLIRQLFQPDRHQMGMFVSIADAMQRMAKGDFNINVEVHPRFAGQWAFLVRSLNKMASELGQIEQMRQEFISNVSHEIQSPLTSISGFAKALRSDDLPPDKRMHYLQIIENECARLSKISDNLLKLTSLESKHHPFQPKPFRLDRQIRRVILSFEPQWTGKSIDMDVDLQEATVEADEELLSQVWVNLLGNAIKYTPTGGQIRFTLEQEDRWAKVSVTDNGIGVSADDLPHLFERFYKADKSRNRESGGSGLGLSIVRKIVDMHAGTIDVASVLGEGTTFTVRMPLRQNAAESASAPGRSPRDAAHSGRK